MQIKILQWQRELILKNELKKASLKIQRSRRTRNLNPEFALANEDFKFCGTTMISDFFEVP